MQFYSHPDKLLRDHLKEVSKEAVKYITDAGREDLSVYARIAGGLHDVGKYTDMFQSKLASGRRAECSDHSLISSLIAYNEAYRTTSNKLYSLLTMIAVASHHGRLKGIGEIYESLSDLMLQVDNSSGADCTSKQYTDLRSKWELIRKELSWLNLSDLPPLSLIVKNPKDAALEVKGRTFGWKEYFDGLLLFSVLIDADKHSASGFEEPNPEPPSADELINFSSTLPKYGNEVDKIREELFEWAKEKADARSQKLVLSAPTGSGKTLSGVLVGLRSGKRRIIYSLPYISIIEQTGSVLSKAFNDEAKEFKEKRVLTYHHLSFSWDLAGVWDENRDVESRMMLAESWSNPIIVTTFEAFVSSFLSNKSSYLKRLHNIANSYIILDEVQSLPVEKIALIKEAVEELAENLNSKILVMSATVPLIYENVERPVKYAPNRYTIRFMDVDSFLTPSELAQRIELSGKSVMMEMNTIGSAEELYSSLGDREVEFLSTRVIPKERMKRIAKMKERLDRGEKIKLVTTQIVEAGVDLDFEVGYRDLGPLDSVVQAAGRINRNYRAMGDLYVYRIRRKEMKRTDFSLVYGKITENITLQTLKQLSESSVINLEEKDVERALAIYYDKVKDYLRPEASPFAKDVLEMIKRLEYNEVEVKLIEEELKYTVFIEYDDEAKKIWENLRSELNQKNGDAFKRRAKVKALLSNAQQYIVNTINKPEVDYDERLGWYFVPRDLVSKYYDETLGLRVHGSEEKEDDIW